MSVLLCWNNLCYKSTLYQGVNRSASLPSIVYQELNLSASKSVLLPLLYCCIVFTHQNSINVKALYGYEFALYQGFRGLLNWCSNPSSIIGVSEVLLRLWICLVPESEWVCQPASVTSITVLPKCLYTYLDWCIGFLRLFIYLPCTRVWVGLPVSRCCYHCCITKVPVHITSRDSCGAGQQWRYGLGASYNS